MIGQYLSNTNESAILSIFQKYLELNKALPLSQVLVANFTCLGTAQARSVPSQKSTVVLCL